MPDPAASGVRALGVDAQGAVYADVGLSGQVRKADELGTVSVPTGLPAGRAPGTPPQGAVPVAGRLAPDGSGGFFLTAGPKIVRIEAPRTAALNVGVAPGGVSLETIAGDPAAMPGRSGGPSAGDGGPYREARFQNALSLGSDGAGNVFVADRIDRNLQSFRVRFLNRGPQSVTFYSGTPEQVTVAPGTIQTIAGMPGQSNAGDGGAAVKATLAGEPPSLAAAPDRLYMGLTFTTPGGAQRTSVRMINLGGRPARAHGVQVNPGSIATVAGGGRIGFAGDGEPALRGRFSRLPGIAADGGGNLYLADRLNHRIRKVDSGGLLTTFAGSASVEGGFNGHGLRATRALLKNPFDVKVGPQDRVYISDEGNGLVRVVDESGMMMPGPGNMKVWRCEEGSGPPGARQSPRQATLLAVAVDRGGSVFFADRTGSRLLRITRPGQIEPAGRRQGNASSGPVAINAAPGGGLLVLLSGQAGLVHFNPGPGSVRSGPTDLAPGEQRTIARAVAGREQSSRRIPLTGEGPSAVAAGSDGSVFIASPNASGVIQIAASGKVTTFAGPGSAAGGLAKCCTRPAGLAVDRGGNLYVADPGSSIIWFINRGRSPVRIQGATVAPGVAHRIAGTGVSQIGGEGARAAETTLERPSAITVDRRGNVYFVEEAADSVRKIDAGGLLTTVAGTGHPGFNGEGLRGKLTALNDPGGLAVDRCGNLLIADQGNDMIRRLNVSNPCALQAAAGASGERAPATPALVAGAAGTAIALLLGWLASKAARRGRKKGQD